MNSLPSADSVISARERGRAIVAALVERYRSNRADYLRPDYNESQVRNDFLNAFLTALGWDVHNEQGLPHRLREVVVEESIQVADEANKKKPDYTLRALGERKFFFEAKKPSVAIQTAREPAFQLRRYGWNAGMAMSALTNFDKLAFYDCRYRPQEGDEVGVARLRVYSYEEYVEKFDDIYDQISREVVYSGQFDTRFAVDQSRPGTEPFDDFFLRQIDKWRERLAAALADSNPSLNAAQLNFLIQRLINRIVFLRICEDREPSKYEDLKKVTTYDQLKALFQEADLRYNSGLFDFIEDHLSLTIEVQSDVLIAIFDELYFPKSSYDFSVVESQVLGQIYELFLAKEVAVSNAEGPLGRAISVQVKPEIAHSDGVVSTPACIVERILGETLIPWCAGKSPAQLESLRLADIASGSGIFLVAAYDYLLSYHLDWYLRDPEAHHDRLVHVGSGQYQLALAEKRRILLSAIHGVDIDIQAVEITRFSLLLKVLEGETEATIDAQRGSPVAKALPNLNQNVQCGNSLVDSRYYEFDAGSVTTAEDLEARNPFDWADAFAAVMAQGGFDLIVGNPPYIRIQNMVRYAAREVTYYQNVLSGYATAQQDNFDKYALFIERALQLLNPRGVLGFIVPHKFFKVRSGNGLRKVIVAESAVAKIVHFGVEQVFKGRTTYTCILVLSKAPRAEFVIEHVTDLPAWRYGHPGAIETRSNAELAKKSAQDAPWIFLPPRLNALFERLESSPATHRLDQVADIFVGVQTSRDKVYLVKPSAETETTITFQDKGKQIWTIEKAITRPSLLDVPLQAFGTPTANTRMIFPYRIEDAQAILYTPEQMQTQFPRCWEYLNAHRADLERRDIQNGTPETWYRFGRSQSLTRFDGRPKIIWPVLSLGARYAYDTDNVLITGGGNGPYYALRLKEDSRLSLLYLLAVLCHPVIELKVLAGGSDFRGGYISHGKQYIADLPVRQIDWDNPTEVNLHEEITDLSAQLVQATQAIKAADTPHQRELHGRRREALKRRVDQKIETLYGMAAEDLKITAEVTAEESPSGEDSAEVAAQQV